MSSVDSSAGVLKDKDGALAKHGVHLKDNEIRWNKDAEGHPRNWKPFTKWYTTIVICWLELYMTGISSAGVRLHHSPYVRSRSWLTHTHRQVLQILREKSST